jgi:hypothetical protein
MPPMVDDAVEADVRRYMARLARRIVPPAVLLLAAVLVAAMVAITGRTSGNVSVGAPSSGGSTNVATQPGVVSQSGARATPGTTTPALATPGGHQAAVVPTSVPTAEAPGVARSGVTCGPGVRQIPWTKYAPLCVPAFTGANGGATAPGVTATTITLSYRRQNSGEQAAITAIAGAATPVDDPYLSDLDTFVSLFNTDYELYGRKVVVKPFQGQGDYLEEDLGQDQEAAQADAVTAQQEGAFADVTFPSAGSLFYSQALAAAHVVNWGFPFDPQSWYQQYSPYEYNDFLDGTKWSEWMANFACQRLIGQPAVFAGDASLQTKTRVFGLVNVEFPTWAQVADNIVSRLSTQCGIKIARRVSYPEDIGAFQQNGSNMAAQLRAAGVTTVICYCDPLMPIFITQAATSQGYHPEWIFQNDFDPIAQDADQTQFAHAMAPGPSVQAGTTSEAYRAYQLANPGRAPASIYYEAAYEMALQLFGALQAAGPDLNPLTLQRGMFSLPPSLPGGDYGNWIYGNGAFTPEASAQVVYWDPKRLSIDGKAGTWTACEDAATFPFNDQAGWGAAHTQPHCFGR